MVTTFANLKSDMTQYSGSDGTQIDAYLSQPGRWKLSGSDRHDGRHGA